MEKICSQVIDGEDGARPLPVVLDGYDASIIDEDGRDGGIYGGLPHSLMMRALVMLEDEVREGPQHAQTGEILRAISRGEDRVFMHGMSPSDGELVLFKDSPVPLEEPFLRKVLLIKTGDGNLSNNRELIGTQGFVDYENVLAGSPYEPIVKALRVIDDKVREGHLLAHGKEQALMNLSRAAERLIDHYEGNNEDRLRLFGDISAVLGEKFLGEIGLWRKDQSLTEFKGDINLWRLNNDEGMIKGWTVGDEEYNRPGFITLEDGLRVMVVERVHGEDHPSSCLKITFEIDRSEN